jgi:acetyl-CoA carboxylase carboxyltransferase component
MGKWINGYLDKLADVRRQNLAGGCKDGIETMHRLGKLTARERIERLVDPGTFDEIGSLVTDSRPPLDDRSRPAPSDGIVMGVARVNGAPISLYAMDFTVMSGSLGDQAAWKLSDLTKMSGQMQIPIIGMIDCAGARLGIKGGDSGFNGFSQFIRNYCHYSGVIPRIALLLGPCTGLMAAIPVLSDFLIINEKTGFLWLGGDRASADAGTAGFHMESSGQCDLIADSDEDAIQMAKTILSYIPPNCWQKPIRRETDDDFERREEKLLAVMPDDPKFTYDIHEIIDLIVDDGVFLELKEDFAAHLVTGFARFGGFLVGIVANNPDELSGIIEPDASWERLGVIRHGAKLLHSYAHLTCPKITMVLRRSYGGANIVMGCSKMFPDFIYAWPTAEFAPTGPETVVHAVFHKELAKAKEDGNYDEVYDFFLSILKEQFSVMNLAKHWTTYYTVHEVIDPRDTRSRIIKALEAIRNKQEKLPEKKRSIKPA